MRQRGSTFRFERKGNSGEPSREAASSVAKSRAAAAGGVSNLANSPALSIADLYRVRKTLVTHRARAA
jgi:hypothetical protein